MKYTRNNKKNKQRPDCTMRNGGISSHPVQGGSLRVDANGGE